ncbi:unnamed protein product [marine sediment metagenome]|uniref:Uncharacterized protein n=1 Tax=marine sediment metagenome TaxID=412755 RepID=X0V0Q8_9ZZZZ
MDKINALSNVLIAMKDTFVKDKNEKDEIISMVIELIKVELKQM